MTMTMSTASADAIATIIKGEGALREVLDSLGVNPPVPEIRCFAHIDFEGKEMPNIWERHYTLPNGQIGTITHLDPEEFHPYSVVIHSQAPDFTRDWWDFVVKDLGPADTIEGAEALLLEAGATV